MMNGWLGQWDKNRTLRKCQKKKINNDTKIVFSSFNSSQFNNILYASKLGQKEKEKKWKEWEGWFSENNLFRNLDIITQTNRYS